jgi:hypothetical protein
LQCHLQQQLTAAQTLEALALLQVLQQQLQRLLMLVVW